MQARRYIRQMGYKARVAFQQLYPNAPPLATDLLVRMLAFDPSKRCTVEEALAHPYLASLHDPEEEPGCDAIFNFDFEHFELQKDTFQGVLLISLSPCFPLFLTTFSSVSVYRVNLARDVSLPP